MNDYKYIYPPNARHQEQLDIMLKSEANGQDPFDPNYIQQEILFETKYWYVTKNKFPYENAELHFLIIARRGVYDLNDVTSEMQTEFFEIWKKLINEYSACGGGLCWRFGDPACSGASLKRLHAHLIIPQPDKKVKVGIGGKRKLSDDLVIRD